MNENLFLRLFVALMAAGKRMGAAVQSLTGVTFLSELIANVATRISVSVSHTYHVECYNQDGVLKWAETAKNLVVTVGLNEILDKFYKGITYTAAHYVGLKGTGSIAAGDTMSSHAGWSEIAAYSEGTRPAFTPGTVSAGSVDNSASKASFSINGSATVAGAFLATDSTKSGTAGILIGAADFGASRSVVNGDTLNVTVTATMAAA